MTTREQQLLTATERGMNLLRLAGLASGLTETQAATQLGMRSFDAQLATRSQLFQEKHGHSPQVLTDSEGDVLGIDTDAFATEHGRPMVEVDLTAVQYRRLARMRAL